MSEERFHAYPDGSVWWVRPDTSQSIALEREEAIDLRDHLLRAYPLDGWASPGAIAAVAEYASHRERREKIATAVLGGLVGDRRLDGVNYTQITDWCVKAADALISELDREF